MKIDKSEIFFMVLSFLNFVYYYDTKRMYNPYSYIQIFRTVKIENCMDKNLFKFSYCPRLRYLCIMRRWGYR